MVSLLGTVFTFSAAALALIFGLIYLTRSRFMNYHQMAIQKKWEELPKELQTLLIALMRAMSSGFLAVALALAILQLQFIRTHDHWIALTILAVGTILGSGSLYAMLLVRTRTKGRPPIIPVLVIFILLIAGYFFNIYS